MNWIDRTIVRQRKTVLRNVAIAGLTLLCGCSLGKPPTDTVAKAELDLRAAREAKADELAPVTLRGAREKLDKSKEAMADKRYDDARRLAESAQVDAELAEAQAEARMMRQALDAVRGGGGDAPPSKAELESRQPFTTKAPKE